MSDAQQVLQALTTSTADAFERNQRILSFREYLELTLERPWLHARGVAQYVRDCFDHFGFDDVETPWGTSRGWRLFDAVFDDGEDRLVGQHQAQAALYRTLGRFVQDGRIQRLILLHGPNGSAKSSLIQCIMRALEAYSHTDEGALYQFNWIFPAEKIARSGIGFGGGLPGTPDTSETFAYLDELDVDAKLSSELRESPLMLLPRDERVAMLQDALGDREFVLADAMRKGELSHKSRQIFDALLTACRGDLSGVYRHVQVERFYVSRRYRRAAVTIEPQLRVDAGVRQITVDRSLQSLPASLQNHTLFEPFGDLVDGNRGIVEYNDLLKRPHDFNKYLLATSEKGTVALENCILYLDALLIGSANETYIDAFKQTPDYPSFQARLEFIRMPYLRDFLTEQRIYDEQITQEEIGKPIAPYASLVAALWAVLTRLVRPRAERYEEELRETIDALTPQQKADLYARGDVPPGLSTELRRNLHRCVPDMMVEGSESVAYEGRFGASPRLMKTVIRNAAQNLDYPHLSPLAILDEVRELAKQKDIYPFLSLEADNGYRDYSALVDTVHERYVSLIDADLRRAVGLVTEEQYELFFDRYIENVTHWIKGEKIYNPVTGNSTPPDREFMVEVEQKLGATGEGEEFRTNIMGTIAAWSIDNPSEPLHYPTIFASHLEALRQAFYDDRLAQVRTIVHDIVAVFSGEEDQLDVAQRSQVTTTVDALIRDYGYTQDSAREAVTHLLQERYQ